MADSETTLSKVLHMSEMGEGEECRLSFRLKEQQITQITLRSPYGAKIKATVALSTAKLTKSLFTQSGSSDMD